MNRCHPKRVLLALAASLAVSIPVLLASGPAVAQMKIVREAPRDVTLGKMTVTGGQAIDMDGKPDRLSPGVRIRDVRNMLVLPGTLNGQTVPVVYKREATTGLVHEVWLLTADEYQQLAKAKGGASAGDGVQQFINLLAALWAARP